MNKKYYIVGAVVIILLIIGYINAPAYRGYQQATSSYTPSALQDVSYDEGYGETVAMEANLGMAKMRASGSIAPPSPEPPGYQTGGGEEFIPENRLIIKTANMSVVVDNVRAAVESVVNYAETQGGFEVNRNIYKQGVGLVGSVTVRIPVKAFDAGLEEVRNLGEVKSQNVNGRDVTEEFVDVQAQLHNLAATEKQFLEIMKRATEIKDVLAVQRELTNIRGQIERLEGRKKYLQLSADLSTLTVHFSTNPDTLPIVDEQDTWKPLGVAKDAARDLLNLGKNAVNALIWVVVYIPLWIVLGAVIYFVHRWMKKRHA